MKNNQVPAFSQDNVIPNGTTVKYLAFPNAKNNVLCMTGIVEKRVKLDSVFYKIDRRMVKSDYIVEVISQPKKPKTAKNHPDVLVGAQVYNLVTNPTADDISHEEHISLRKAKKWLNSDHPFGQRWGQWHARCALYWMTQNNSKGIQ